MTTDALELAGQRVVNEMTRLWALDIVDYPITSPNPRTKECIALISEIIAFGGWMPDGGYRGGNSSPQWCGLTMGWAWSKGGMDPRYIRVWWASTMRLIAWFDYHDWNDHRNPRPKGDDVRLLQGLHPGAAISWTPRAGDVAIVGDGRDVSGQHITGVVSWDAARRSVSTISGNGGGLGPHGGPAREGVSARDYAIDVPHGYRVIWIGRPAFSDLLAERG